jgi:pilus assembly protein CpaD
MMAAAGLAALLGGCTGVIPNPPQTNLAQTADGKNQAVVSGCPNWEIPEGASWTNAPSPNFGCATAQNLAAMVVDPTDLVEGKKPGVTPASRLTLRDDQWRGGFDPMLEAGAGASDTRE